MSMSSKRQKTESSLIRSITVFALVITVMASAAQGVALCFNGGCSAAVAGPGTTCACSQRPDHCGISEEMQERLLAGCNCTHPQLELDKAITPCDSGPVFRVPAERSARSLFTIRLQHTGAQAGTRTITQRCAGPGPILCHIRAVVLLT